MPNSHSRKLCLAFGLTVAATEIPMHAQIANVLTFHNDNLRTGQNLNEGILTPQNVSASTFGKLFNYTVDGKVDAQPLYVTSVLIGSHRHNLLLVATEHDSVYAVDADNGTLYWQVSLAGPGETSSDARNCNQVFPEIGITATPVIDLNAGPHGTIYVIAMSKGSGGYFQRLHALDLTTGAEQFGGPTTVQASVAGSGDADVFDAKQYKDRPGLLLVRGTVYTSWGSHCDVEPYSGWSIGYSENTLQQTTAFNFTPNGSEAAPWNAGGAPASDVYGNIFYSLGNGTFDTTLNAFGFPSQGDFGNSIVKLSVAADGKLFASDYWTMNNTVSESSDDTDLGSGGLVLIPDQIDSSGTIKKLIAVAGKDSNLYIGDRLNGLGGYDPTNDSTLYQQLSGALPNGVWSNPAYFNHTLYFGSIGNSLRAFPITNAIVAAQPSSTTSDIFQYPGANPSISAYGTSNGILWTIANGSSAALFAYNANDLTDKLYDSTQAQNNRDAFGSGNKFIVPTIANGKVYAATTNSVAAFGLLKTAPGPIPDGVYLVVNQCSGLNLDDPGVGRFANPGVQMIQWPLNNNTNQNWFFSNQGNGYYLIQNTDSGLYLTDTNGALAWATPLEQQARTFDDSQLWQLVSSGTGYAIQNKETSLVMDDAGASLAPRTGIILYPLKAEDQRINQTWTIE